MIQYLKNLLPQKYRLITFFITTSIIGVLLIFFAAYNASKDLEILSDIKNTHKFLQVGMAGYDKASSSVEVFNTFESYQLIIVDGENFKANVDVNLPLLFPREMDELEESRKNQYGGYVDIDKDTYTWSSIFITESQQYMLLIHKFYGVPVSSLVNIYFKRLFVPGIFYIWLMFWVALILRFLTERLISQNEELEHKALHDSLTELPNRILLNKQILKSIENCQRNKSKFSLAVIDLNKFKEINDTHGHDQGDELLCLVAKRINNVLRTSDMLARIGGDEFVLLFNDADEKSSIMMCERIKHSVLQPYSLREACVNIGLSIGIALFPEHGQDPKTLMRNADLAMYAVKSKGGGIKLYKENTN